MLAQLTSSCTHLSKRCVVKGLYTIDIVDNYGFLLLS